MLTVDFPTGARSPELGPTVEAHRLEGGGRLRSRMDDKNGSHGELEDKNGLLVRRRY